MDKEYNHIVFCINDDYAKYLQVVIKSIVCHNCDQNIIIHILSDYLSGNNIRLLNDVVCNTSSIRIEIHIIDDVALKGLKISRKWPIQAWYRLLIPQILDKSIRVALYLDADTLVVGNLNDVFSTNLDGISIAAVIEASVFNKSYYERLGMRNDQRYICSGVLLMNLDFWREHDLSRKMIAWAKCNNLQLPDQDTINYFCRDSKKVLPLRYGIVHFFFCSDEFYKEPYLSELQDCLEHPIIIHYAFCYPWQKDASRHIMHKEWVKYNRMLSHPVKSTYNAKGWLLMKMVLWDILHLFKDRRTLNVEEVKAEIKKKKRQLC